MLCFRRSWSRGITFCFECREEFPCRLLDRRFHCKTEKVRNGSYDLHADMNRRLVAVEGSKRDSRFARHAKDVADECDMAVGLKMLQYLIDRAVDRHPSFHLQAAAFLPWYALHPADIAENAAVAPPVGVNINGKHSLQRAIDYNVKFMRPHGARALQFGRQRRAQLSVRPAAQFRGKRNEEQSRNFSRITAGPRPQYKREDRRRNQHQQARAHRHGVGRKTRVQKPAGQISCNRK